MEHTYHLTRISGNAKTGPIPVSTTSRSTCPAACPLKGNGCYADSGPLALHWNAVSKGSRGHDIDHFCNEIRRLPKGQLWRYGQAGDLPGDTHQIDAESLQKIVDANRGRRGFAYTHYPAAEPENARAVESANAAGFVINLSANDLDHADQLADLGIAPVVTLLPADQVTPTVTPAGRTVAICPASVRDDVSCATCGVCAVAHRKAIIGFPAHGSGAKKAQRVFFMRQERGGHSAVTLEDAPTASPA